MQKFSTGSNSEDKDSENVDGSSLENQELHLRICYDSLIGRQATPYFIGPIPLGDASEKGNTALLPMKVTPNIDTKSPIKIEPVNTVATLPKAVNRFCEFFGTNGK